ncbi:MAG: hypothetical protein KDE28_01870 [Anaerolineales bacterium]|nr:hypothetical protein [Anaerolineales bacterium]
MKKQIIQAGKILDIPLMDHIVIGTGRYLSLKARDLVSLRDSNTASISSK